MAEIEWIRTVVRDGWHNAFTDLCYWRGFYWLTFRRGSAHVSPYGGVIVMRSTDLKRWKEIATLNTAGDDRDPKFCVAEDRLYVYFGTRFTESNGKVYYYSYVAFSDDGVEWSSPTRIYKRNYWLWRVRRHNGRFYSPAYGWRENRRGKKYFLDLLVSDDGVNWHKRCRIGGENLSPNEADIWFWPNEAWCIARSARKSGRSIFFLSKPPYEEWRSIDLDSAIHSPVFCMADGELYLAGRLLINGDQMNRMYPGGRTAIFRVDRGRAEIIIVLPSGGDTAYPGLISRDQKRLIVSYYSQHAYLGGVIEPHSPDRSDVYLAMIKLD